MSGRCKGCNAILDEQEMRLKWPGSVEYTELCLLCLPPAIECLEDFHIQDKDCHGKLY